MPRPLPQDRCKDERVDDEQRHDLADRWPLPGPDARALRDRLLDAYADPSRGYHDLTHLAEVLTRIDDLATAETDLDVVLLLAAWFHDAVYDEQGHLEERSAALAETELTLLGLDSAAVAEGARLVRLTATHQPDDDDRRGQVLCDADLAILAAGAERYAAYVAGVRKDFAHVGEAAFRWGRAAVLKELAARPILFHTERGRQLWEVPTRANLARELAELEG